MKRYWPALVLALFGMPGAGRQGSRRHPLSMVSYGQGPCKHETHDPQQNASHHGHHG